MELTEEIKEQIILGIKENTADLKGKKQETERAIRFHQVVLTLQNVGFKIPAHWLISLTSGRTDRIFA